MAPELKEKNEFSEWLERWLAKIQTRAFIDPTLPKKETGPEEEERPMPAHDQHHDPV